ncbi:SDR family oxidoreductase [Salinactinospora qingdaonensis]
METTNLGNLNGMGEFGPRPLDGATAIITGASRGIGRAIALRLASDGAHVVVNYRSNAEAAQATVSTIESHGGLATPLQGDVSSSEDVERLFDDAEKINGGVDILVANAGLVVLAPLGELDEADVDRMIATNLKGTFLVMRQAARRLRDGGRVIAISGEATRSAPAGFGAAAGTKAAVEAMAVALSKEVGPRRITVNSVLPGVTPPERITPQMQPHVDAVVAATPLGRAGTPHDIADVVGFLASDDARWITGQTIVATGGAV